MMNSKVVVSGRLLPRFQRKALEARQFAFERAVNKDVTVNLKYS